MTEDTLKFAMFLTGHDEATIRQLYSDFQKRQLWSEVQGNVAIGDGHM